MSEEINTIDKYLFNAGYEAGYRAGKKDCASPWISCKDRLPEEDELVFVKEEIWRKSDGQSKKTFGYDIEIWVNMLAEPHCFRDDLMIIITHWMEIPSTSDKP